MFWDLVPSAGTGRHTVPLEWNYEELHFLRTHTKLLSPLGKEMSEEQALIGKKLSSPIKTNFLLFPVHLPLAATAPKPERPGHQLHLF